MFNIESNEKVAN